MERRYEYGQQLGNISPRTEGTGAGLLVAVLHADLFRGGPICYTAFTKA